MGFLLPIAFGLLSLLAILIVFYLFKKKFERKVISSTYLWDQIMKEWETNRWNKKLNQNLLLLLQILIMLAMIFALARPLIKNEGAISSEQVVVILDTSASMAVSEGETTRFEIAKEQMKKLVKQLNNNQVVTIVNATNSPELLLTNETNHQKINATIDELELSYKVDNLQDSLTLANSLIHQQSAEVHVFSDHVKKKDLDTKTIIHNLTVHNIGEAKENVSVRSFGVKPSGEVVKGVVTIFNEGKNEEKLSIKITSADEVLRQEDVVLPPNKLTVVDINELPPKTVYQVQINKKDPYSLDNQSTAFLANEESPTIYVAGEVNPFIMKALQLFGSEVVTIQGKEDEKLDFPKDVTSSISILSNIPEINWPNGAKLVISPHEDGAFKINGKKDLKYVLNAENDPLLKYVDTENLYLAKSYPIGNLNGLQPVMTSGDDVVLAKGKYNKDPMVLFSFDVEDSDWPLHPSFPVLLNNILNYLKPVNEYLGRFLPGESIDVSYSPTTTNAYLKGLDGSKIRDVKMNLPLEAPIVPGLYELYEKTDTGLTSRYLAIELADREKTAASAESFSLKVEDKQEATKSTGSKEIWYWFAFIALVILFLEWEVYRRGISGR